MAMNKLEVRSYISVKGAPAVRFDSLSAERREECAAEIAENIGKNLSRYLSDNPLEAKMLFEAAKADNAHELV